MNSNRKKRMEQADRKSLHEMVQERIRQQMAAGDFGPTFNYKSTLDVRPSWAKEEKKRRRRR